MISRKATLVSIVLFLFQSLAFAQVEKLTQKQIDQMYDQGFFQVQVDFDKIKKVLPPKKCENDPPVIDTDHDGIDDCMENLVLEVVQHIGINLKRKEGVAVYNAYLYGYYLTTQMMNLCYNSPDGKLCSLLEHFSTLLGVRINKKWGIYDEKFSRTPNKKIGKNAYEKLIRYDTRTQELLSKNLKIKRLPDIYEIKKIRPYLKRTRGEYNYCPDNLYQ